MLHFKSSLWLSLKDFWKKRGKFNSNPQLGLSCNDVYVTRAGLITEGDKGWIYPLQHSFKMHVSTCVCVCVSYHLHQTAPSHHPGSLAPHRKPWGFGLFPVWLWCKCDQISGNTNRSMNASLGQSGGRERSDRLMKVYQTPKHCSVLLSRRELSYLSLWQSKSKLQKYSVYITK